MYFAERLAALADTHAHHPALIDRDAPITFGALHARVGQLAAAFARLGVKAGDRVAIWLPNCLAWVESFLACAHLGALVLAVNTRFRSQEVADIVGRGRADWLVLWPDFKGIAFGEILADVPRESLARLRGVVTVDESGEGHAAREIAARGIAVCDYAAMVDGTLCVPAAHGNASVLCYTTSGTTSLPKFVLHDQHTLLHHGDVMQQAYGYDRDCRILASTPFCGAFGFSTLLGGLASGTTVVCEPVSDTASTLAQIRRHGVTHTYANNESILRLLETAVSRNDFRTCRLFGFASFSPASGDLLDLAKRNGLELTGLYGSSELQALTAAQPLSDTEGDTRVRYLAGGRLIHPEACVRARDPETGAVLPHGESGELEISSPSFMCGYLDDPQATAKAITPDGFFKTGDLGYSVSDRQFVFQTRMGDSLRLSGFLVNPAEIEHALQGLDGIEACQVVGATHAGRIVPFAFVILQPGATADPQGWATQCKRIMASFKVPVRFECVTEFPVVMSANSNKVQKNRLREIADALLAAQP